MCSCSRYAFGFIFLLCNEGKKKPEDLISYMSWNIGFFFSGIPLALDTVAMASNLFFYPSIASD